MGRDAARLQKYTHITKRRIEKIKSPLDNLEIEKGKSET